MPLLLSQSAAASELGVGRDYVRQLIADGHLPIVPVNGEERICGLVRFWTSCLRGSIAGSPKLHQVVR